MFDEKHAELIELISRVKNRSIVNGNKPNELHLGPTESAGLLHFLQAQTSGPHEQGFPFAGVEGIFFMEMSVRCVEEEGVLVCEAPAPLHLVNG